MIPELITGTITIIAGAFFLALTIFGWDEITLFLEPNEEHSMKIMLFFVGIIGAIFFGIGLNTLINITG